MSDILSAAVSLKNSAKAAKEIADTVHDPDSYEDALSDLEEARELLLGELAAVEAQPSGGTEYQQERRQHIARELADCYGLAGGVYRRKGELANALRMYDEGYKYERNQDYKIQDSYNMTNRIVLRILNDPAAFPALAPEIEEAVSLIQQQVEGPRRKQWWAWADLGLLHLLVRDEKLALKDYAEFKNNGALAKHYDSSISVLKDLKQKLRPVDLSISDSIGRAVTLLEEKRPRP